MTNDVSRCTGSGSDEEGLRDAAKQDANHRDDRLSQNCSSFCAAGEPCAITAGGKCDAASDNALLANPRLER